ncbi:MAG: hypothetical protein PWP72_2152 [Thermoanaerobacter sp.]|jgi:hypothetical protein|uniref:Uncharacterized protein n=1 Tax=Moorella mulderi DSM 14980 TaxID=1122241 RepID=A0A151ASW3_9FIRM|nr:hypothetical protein MOMUL_29380 [Moorella mulderi DSM 14980]MDK2889274.1 hypothetical protein [Thermoanaerobacter sp.]GEA14829.1 hypothetical protein E308F_10730 [Moorella sp. E308F]
MTANSISEQLKTTPQICAACRFYGNPRRKHCGLSGKKVNPYLAACQYFAAYEEYPHN